MLRKVICFILCFSFVGASALAMQPMTDTDLEGVTAGSSESGQPTAPAPNLAQITRGALTGDIDRGVFAPPPVARGPYARGGGISIFMDDVKMYVHFDGLWYTDSDGLRGSDGASVGISNFSSAVQINAVTSAR